ncbi:unnamed protein product [Arabis nemorensis]|uniref:Uncharacterized protein n=1 Tax=Arabis nemorensis TaxID=586526 RepID=A0A565C6C2_9BRAS|nr:unnamed protein product [Arabis nemorensis]
METGIDASKLQIRDEELFKAAESGDALLFMSISPQQLQKSLSFRNEDGGSLLRVSASFAADVNAINNGGRAVLFTMLLAKGIESFGYVSAVMMVDIILFNCLPCCGRWSNREMEDLYALDFDGVLYDSCGESSLSAVKAAKVRWPDLFQGVDSALEEWIVEQMHIVNCFLP